MTMWDVPEAKIRAYVERMTKAREERQKSQQKIHFSRIAANIIVNDDQQTVISARVILNELYPRKMFLFTTTPLTPGSECFVMIPEPHWLYIKGRVGTCHEMLFGGRVISSENAFKYRMAVEFEFGNADEERLIREYCAELSTAHHLRQT
jgi:hypothetical protein